VLTLGLLKTGTQGEVCVGCLKWNYSIAKQSQSGCPAAIADFLAAHAIRAPQSRLHVLSLGRLN